MLRARGVTYSYGSGRPAVVDVDVHADGGEVVALVGSNGAGKSTLLRLLDGRLLPVGGQISGPPRRGPDGRVACGFAGESDAHFEPLSGRRNALFFARAGGLGREEADRAVRHLLSELGLAEDQARPVSEYSYGARRKLALVAALAHRPALAILDEPTVGLDAESRGALTRLLRTRATNGRATLLAGHDLDFVARTADRVVFLSRGRVLGGGAPGTLLAGVGDRTCFEVTLAAPVALPDELPEGLHVQRAGNPLRLSSGRGASDLSRVVDTLATTGARIRSVSVREPGLAEAYRRATGEDLDGSSGLDERSGP